MGMPDPQNTTSLADDLALIIAKGVLALAVLAALVALPLLTSETYATGIVTGALAPVLLLAARNLYEETNATRLAARAAQRRPRT